MAIPNQRTIAIGISTVVILLQKEMAQRSLIQIATLPTEVTFLILYLAKRLNKEYKLPSTVEGSFYT